MKPHYRDIIKHSGVYGFGQIVSRLASIVLLPIHTRYLTPTDYGTIAILDLTAGVLAILVSGGMAGALSRYHFDAVDEDAESTVWWTGLAVALGIATLVGVPAFVFRGAIARFTLGPQEESGSFFYLLVLATIWFGILSNISTAYLRVRKWSWLSVNLSLASLVLNVALNVYFLAVSKWGIVGVLAGNLITLMVMSVVRLGIFVRACGRFRFDGPLAGHLLRFGGPLVLTLLCATAMHQADRYLLRLFVDLEQVGLYALAYAMGQGLNSLVLIPFSTIWGVVIYDIAKGPNAKDTYVRVFEYFVYALLLFFLGVSLFVRPLLGIVAAPEYAGAAKLVPIVCLSFVFFSLDDHFKVPALLAKRTVSLIPANAIGATVNIGLNLLWIPRFGAAGAAWASVATYAVFAGVDLVRCRRIDRYDYPLSRCGLILAAMIVSFTGCEYVQRLNPGLMWSLTAPALVWSFWAVLLLYPVLRHYMRPPREDFVTVS